MAPQHLGIIHGKAEKEGKNLEVAVVIGAHPMEMIAASTTLPFGVDHYELAGALARGPSRTREMRNGGRARYLRTQKLFLKGKCSPT